MIEALEKSVSNVTKAPWGKKKPIGKATFKLLYNEKIRQYYKSIKKT